MTSRKSKAVSVEKLLFLLLAELLIFLSIGNVFSFLTSKSNIVVVDSIKKDEAYWERIRENNPTYRDAYIVLAKIKKSQGDQISAARLMEIAKTIDPYKITEN